MKKKFLKVKGSPLSLMINDLMPLKDRCEFYFNNKNVDLFLEECNNYFSEKITKIDFNSLEFNLEGLELLKVNGPEGRVPHITISLNKYIPEIGNLVLPLDCFTFSTNEVFNDVKKSLHSFENFKAFFINNSSLENLSKKELIDFILSLSKAKGFSNINNLLDLPQFKVESLLRNIWFFCVVKGLGWGENSIQEVFILAIYLINNENIGNSPLNIFYSNKFKFSSYNLYSYLTKLHALNIEDPNNKDIRINFIQYLKKYCNSLDFNDLLSLVGNEIIPKIPFKFRSENSKREELLDYFNASFTKFPKFNEKKPAVVPEPEDIEDEEINQYFMNPLIKNEDQEFNDEE